MDRAMKQKQIIILLISSCFLLACSARVPVEQTFKGQQLQIGTVVVNLDESGLDEQRENVFKRIDGVDAIRDEIITILKRHNLYNNASAYSLQVTIDSFKLRHGATRFFAGVFSGSDHLSSKVLLTKDNQVFMNEPVVVSGGNGNPFNISRESRGRGLIHGFANKVSVLLTHRKFSEASAVSRASVDTNSEMHERAVSEVSQSQGTIVTSDDTFSKEQREECTLKQILTMKNAGLTDVQIEHACERR